MKEKGKVQVKSKSNVSWADALEDANRKYAEGRKYVSGMRKAIKIIKLKIASGEPWPTNNPKVS